MRPDGVALGARYLAADLGALAVLCLLAPGVGLLVNVLRPEPLPFRYASAQARLQTAVASLSAGEAATRPVEPISLEAFKQLAAGRTALILDARPDVFYREGHVPGAFNLARESFAADYERLHARLAASRATRIAVYCADADCPDSALVASALEQLGFRHVVDFTDGWEGWTAAGLPVEKQTTP
jgi:rhodanese-related sulfurtransferase